MARYGKRYFWFAAGILINAFGVAAVTRAELGTPPIAGVAYVFSQRFPLTMGQVTFLFNGMLILLQVALLRRKFPPVQLLQMLVNILFSACLDLAMAALDWLRPAGCRPGLPCCWPGAWCWRWALPLRWRPAC